MLPDYISGIVAIDKRTVGRLGVVLPLCLSKKGEAPPTFRPTCVLIWELARLIQQQHNSWPCLSLLSCVCCNVISQTNETLVCCWAKNRRTDTEYQLKQKCCPITSRISFSKKTKCKFSIRVVVILSWLSSSFDCYWHEKNSLTRESLYTNVYYRFQYLISKVSKNFLDFSSSCVIIWLLHWSRQHLLFIVCLDIKWRKNICPAFFWPFSSSAVFFFLLSPFNLCWLNCLADARASSTNDEYVALLRLSTAHERRFHVNLKIGFWFVIYILFCITASSTFLSSFTCLIINLWFLFSYSNAFAVRSNSPETTFYSSTGYISSLCSRFTFHKKQLMIFLDPPFIIPDNILIIHTCHENR